MSNTMFFFSLPSRPSNNKDCKAKCKACSKVYKYTMTTKGNLLKHLQVAHSRELESYKQERLQEQSNGQLLLTEPGRKKWDRTFQNQDSIVTSLVRNLCYQLAMVDCPYKCVSKHGFVIS